jgi:hypothetical protein
VCPSQSRYNFPRRYGKQIFFGASRPIWPYNCDHYEWSRIRRKCQIQMEYGLYLHPPVLGGLGCFNHWLSNIYAPMCKSTVGCQCQRCLHLPTTHNPHHQPGDGDLPNNSHISAWIIWGLCPKNHACKLLPDKNY